MSQFFAKSALVLALSAAAVIASAQDAPGRVGRVALAQGQVMINTPDGEQAAGSLVNWPVTARTQITTERDARTEFSVGSTAIRLDADSSMEVLELDDDRTVLRLHYGSASVRLRTVEAAKGFELSTPQGRVRMDGPGRIRVDAERAPDTLVVNVFEGTATVDGMGSQLLVKSGRRAEVHLDDVRTTLAVRDGFDDWAALRDQAADRAISRYVPQEMTGYEELSVHGSWSNNVEYGPIWLPRRVPVDWAPYRDGRWAWIAPFGWTWVDNAPWGYAPFHYGRWVMVGSRWCWAPGRHVARPVWAPALVGWVGGNGWNVTFNLNGGRRHGPGLGWYPLSPFDNFVPHYRMRHDHNAYFRPHLPRGGRERDRDRDRDDHRRRGLTVVPHDHFGGRGTVMVTNAPRAVVPTVALTTATAVVPPRPQFDGRRPDWRQRDDNRPRDQRDNRDGRDFRDGRNGRGTQTSVNVAPTPAPTAAPAAPMVQAPVQVQPAPVAAVPPQQPDRRPDRRDWRDRPQDNEPVMTRPGEGVGIDNRRNVQRPVGQLSNERAVDRRFGTPPVQQTAPAQVQTPPQRVSPPEQRMAPPPVQQTAPVQVQAPPPQRMSPPPEQRMAPPPVQHAAPVQVQAPPPQRMAPPPEQRMAPPPVQHAAPVQVQAPPPQRMAPAPEPRMAPQPRPEPSSPPQRVKGKEEREATKEQ
jgi:hypothetical protein